MTSTTLETTSAKAAALEGLDFIETEEDVKAVEAATLKIQSTFRGKKIRSKVTPKPAAAAPASQTKTTDKSAPTTTTGSGSASAAAEANKDSDELSKKVAAMQVQDNNKNQMDEQQKPASANTPAGGLPEDEAERAATKIQAGFKGYKTRKELEGKLPPASAGGQQEAPAAAPDGGHAPSS